MPERVQSLMRPPGQLTYPEREQENCVCVCVCVCSCAHVFLNKDAFKIVANQRRER